MPSPPSSAHTPAISVLMAVYNGGRYLRAAIESILCQSWQDFEFIIINDGSTDDTAAILAGYEDKRIVTVANPTNIGLTKSLNKGLHLARGKYIARQDADDVSLPHRLSLQKKLLDQHPETVLVSGEMDFIDENDHVFHRPRLAAEPLLVKWFLLFYNRIGGHSQVMFRKSPVLALGGYDESYRYSQDYALWLKLAERWNLEILHEVVIQYRCAHPRSISHIHRNEQLRYAIQASQRQLLHLFGLRLSCNVMRMLRDFWENGNLTPQANIQACRRLKPIYRAFSQRFQLCPQDRQRITQAIATQALGNLRRHRQGVRLLWYPLLVLGLLQTSPWAGVHALQRLFSARRPPPTRQP